MRHMPMILTVARILCGPIVAGLVLWAASLAYVDRYLSGFIYAGAAALFILASMTDWLDGYLARKYDAVTPLGAALDHCADKVLVACVLLALAYAAFPPNLVAASVLIIGRDIAVAGLREGLSATGRAIPVGQVGKWKAAAEMAGVSVFLAFQAAGPLISSERVIIALDWSARILLWGAAILALVSAAQYAAALRKKA